MMLLGLRTGIQALSCQDRPKGFSENRNKNYKVLIILRMNIHDNHTSSPIK